VEYSNVRALNKIVKAPSKYVRASGNELYIGDDTFSSHDVLKNGKKTVLSKICAQNGIPCRRMKMLELKFCLQFPTGYGRCKSRIVKVNPNQDIRNNFYASAVIDNGKIRLFRRKGFTVIEKSNKGEDLTHARLSYEYSLGKLNDFVENHEKVKIYGFERVTIRPSVTLFIFLKEGEEIYVFPVVKIDSKNITSE
jgi:hypothetical protein